jgi:hypothetical protein
VGSVVVVELDEPVEEVLEFGDGGGLGLTGEPALEGLLEAFDLPAGRRVVRTRVLLGDAAADEFGL